MARISKITLKHQPSFHALTIRKTIDFMQEYSSFAGYAFDKITEYLQSLNELPSAAPLVCFHNMDLEKLDVEIGFPVATVLSGKDDMLTNTIPAQKVVTAIDLGPYEKQDPTLSDIFEFVQTNGYELKGDIYYHYLNDAERPEEELLTMMVLPIK